MLPMTIKSGANLFAPQPSLLPSSTTKAVKPSAALVPHKRRTASRFGRMSVDLTSTQTRTLAIAEGVTAEATSVSDGAELEAQISKIEVEVGQMEKPRLVLKFIWMEKNIGLALDQLVPGHGTIPLSPYYFWPRKDAWEELKATLESKPWITQKMMIILLNQATDIINLWQQSGGNLTSSS